MVLYLPSAEGRRRTANAVCFCYYPQACLDGHLGVWDTGSGFSEETGAKEIACALDRQRVKSTGLSSSYSHMSALHNCYVVKISQFCNFSAGTCNVLPVVQFIQLESYAIREAILHYMRTQTNIY